jgi:hypothetical protein
MQVRKPHKKKRVVTTEKAMVVLFVVGVVAIAVAVAA